MFDAKNEHGIRGYASFYAERYNIKLEPGWMDRLMEKIRPLPNCVYSVGNCIESVLHSVAKQNLKPRDVRESIPNTAPSESGES